MNERNLHIDLIEKYLDDSLNRDEAALFNKTLENNEDFVRELNDMELLISGIKLSATTTTLEEKLARFEKSTAIVEKEDDHSITNISKFGFNQIKKYSWAIAASLTILMVCTLTIFDLHLGNPSQNLYAKYFTPFENHGNLRSAESTSKNYWKEALFYYDEGMYEEALGRFDQFILSDYKDLVNHPKYTLYKLYKGNTLMMLNRHNEAKALFEGIIMDGDGMIMQARWYLSMCYLHEKNRDKLMPLLESMSKVKSSSYGRDAKEILNELK